MNENEIRSFYDGVREGVWTYAWMKDGVYYVGTTGKTLQEAYKAVEEELQQQLDKLK